MGTNQLSWTELSPQNSYVEALAPNVFGDVAFKVIKVK